MKLRHACRENIAVLACSCVANGLHWTTASNRLIPSGDRSPRSPEVTRTPSGRQTRGRFVFGVCKGYPCIEPRLRNSFRPEASGCLQPKQGRGCDRRKCAASRCFGAGCAKNGYQQIGLECPYLLPVDSSRQSGTSNQQAPAAWAQAPSGARGFAGSVCQGLQGGVPQR
jgi:hypothetical protein